MNGPASTAMAASSSSGSGPQAGPAATNGTPATPAPDALGTAPSDRVDVIDHAGGRILCVADIRGKISRLNDLARVHGAVAIIHTGDFGFYDRDSIDRIGDRTLRHLIQYSALIDQQVREKHFPSNPKESLSLGQMREKLLNPSPELLADQKGVDFILSEFPKLLAGEIKLNVPVYAVWGACEDISILEKIRLAPASSISAGSNAPHSAAASANEYSIPNLTVLSESVTRCLVIGGVRLRLFGLGGTVVAHKLFDNGEGNATMAGGNGTMWTTALQIGELIDTAQRVWDPSETRVLVTHGAIGREGLLAQAALAVKADFTISASLHFRYGSSYNDFGTQTDPDSFRAKFVQANKGFMEVYDSVKAQVEQVIDDQQKKLLQNALGVARRIPQENTEEPAWKNAWHWNLPDANYGSLVLDIREGRVAAEMKSSGFNFAYRMKGNAQPLQQGNQGQANRNVRPPYQAKAFGQQQPQQLQQQQSQSTPNVASSSGPAASATTPQDQPGTKPAEKPSDAAPSPAQSSAPPRDAFTSLTASAFSGPNHAGRGHPSNRGFPSRGRGRFPSGDYGREYRSKDGADASASAGDRSEGPAPTNISKAADQPQISGDKQSHTATASHRANGSGSPVTERNPRKTDGDWRSNSQPNVSTGEGGSGGEGSGPEGPFRGRGRGRGGFRGAVRGSRGGRGNGNGHRSGGSFEGGSGSDRPASSQAQTPAPVAPAPPAAS